MSNTATGAAYIVDENERVLDALHAHHRTVGKVQFAVLNHDRHLVDILVSKGERACVAYQRLMRRSQRARSGTRTLLTLFCYEAIFQQHYRSLQRLARSNGLGHPHAKQPRRCGTSTHFSGKRS